MSKSNQNEGTGTNLVPMVSDLSESEFDIYDIHQEQGKQEQKMEKYDMRRRTSSQATQPGAVAMIGEKGNPIEEVETMGNKDDPFIKLSSTPATKGGLTFLPTQQTQISGSHGTTKPDALEEANARISAKTVARTICTLPESTNENVSLGSPPPPPVRVDGSPAPACLARASARTEVSMEPGAYAHGGGAPSFSAPRQTSEDVQSPSLAVLDSGNNSLGQNDGDELEDPELAVAREVDEGSTAFDMPRAHQMDSDTAHQSHRKGQKKILSYGAGGCLLLIVIVAIVVAAVLTTSSSQSMSTGEASTGTNTSQYADALGDMEHVKELYDGLPISTKENLLDITTPQAKAWEWLQQHQNITNLPEWRKQQLFALVTFFHAFEGDKWPDQYSQHWLNDTVDECSWINTDQQFLYGMTALYIHSTYDYTPCNVDGQIQTLALMRLELASASPFIPPEISLLPSLSNLVFPFNDINVPLSSLMPKELYQLSNLQYFVLHSNQVYGTIPEDIHRLTALETILLGFNEISGTIPTGVARLSQLKLLMLHVVPVTGTIPSELGLLTQLTELELYDTGVTGQIPTEVGLMTNMLELALHLNQLTGPIPSQLGLLTSLNRHIMASENSLSGTIPRELSMLRSMAELELHDNHLTGEIPSQLGLLTSLQELQLHNTGLTGTIPSDLGSLTQIQHLSLGNNAISGSIPVELWNLSGLKQLDLSLMPLLSGTIPSDLCHLHFNDFCSYDYFFAVKTECYVEFDCSERLCGCDCPCHETLNHTI